MKHRFNRDFFVRVVDAYVREHGRQELADAVGVHHNTIGWYLTSDKRVPRADTLGRIATVTKVPVSKFFDADEPVAA